MPRHIHTIECEFEWHVRRIIRKLIKDHDDDDLGESIPFEHWIEENHKAVAHAFLDDVDSWMGLDEAIADARKET